MPITPDISRKLLELKEECGLTFKQIGDEVGSSEANVRRYIMGETKVPDKQLLYAIIRVLDGDPDEMLGKKKQESAPPAQTAQPVDYSLYTRQEERHKEILAHWSERHREEIGNLKAAYETTIQSKDAWILRIKKELDDAEGELLEVKKERRKLRLTIGILSGLLALFILAYLIPDLANGDWGHILYNVSAPFG